MNEFPFRGLDLVSLRIELSSPIASIALAYSDCGVVNPAKVIICLETGSFVSFRSEMHDVCDRVEIGVLDINIEADMRYVFSEFDVDEFHFKNMLQINRILILKKRIGNILYSSGIKFICDNGRDVIVSAADYPFTIYTDGPHIRGRNVAPEYPLEEYEQVEVTGWS